MKISFFFSCFNTFSGSSNIDIRIFKEKRKTISFFQTIKRQFLPSKTPSEQEISHLGTLLPLHNVQKDHFFPLKVKVKKNHIDITSFHQLLLPRSLSATFFTIKTHFPQAKMVSDHPNFVQGFQSIFFIWVSVKFDPI